MKNHILYCLLAVSGMGHSLIAQETHAWEYKGEVDGIKIFHQKTSGLLHIKLSTAVRVPLAGVATLFSDVDRYKDWGYKIVESKMLKRISPTEVWYYARYDFPWPLDDRDIILQSKMHQDLITRQIKISNYPHPAYLPEKAGIVRIKNTTTHWTFTPGTDGWVSMEQLISTDSANQMPEWLVKMTADTGPRETAKAVRNLLRQEKYQNAWLAHIKN